MFKLVWEPILKISALMMVIVACEDSFSPSKPKPVPGPYPIETEISLCPDRQYIYFVVTDTVTAGNNGIYRARISKPEREPILMGDSLHSPVISFNNQLLAFLKFGKIRYFRLPDQVEFSSTVMDSFNSMIFINDSLIVACRDTALYFVNESNLTSTYYGRGWDPTLSDRDNFIYFGGTRAAYRILEGNVNDDFATLREIIVTDAHPHWPTIIEDESKYVYGIEWVEQKFIYSLISGQKFTFIDSSKHSKPYLVNSDLILFTGPDGRIYSSDFEGTLSVPFIPEAEG